jgi:hypothetical protein
MHLPIPEQGQWLGSVVRGHLAYFAVPGNIKAVDALCDQATRHWFKALRRRSQRTSLHWPRMHRLAQRWLPPPRILHPWPDERFDVGPEAGASALAVHAGICAGGRPSPQGEGRSLPRSKDVLAPSCRRERACTRRCGALARRAATSDVAVDARVNRGALVVDVEELECVDRVLLVGGCRRALSRGARGRAVRRRRRGRFGRARDGSRKCGAGRER